MNSEAPYLRSLQDMLVVFYLGALTLLLIWRYNFNTNAFRTRQSHRSRPQDKVSRHYIICKHIDIRWQDMRKGTTSRIYQISVLKCLYLCNHSSYELETLHEYSLLHSMRIWSHAHYQYGRGKRAHWLRWKTALYASLGRLIARDRRLAVGSNVGFEKLKAQTAKKAQTVKKPSQKPKALEALKWWQFEKWWQSVTVKPLIRDYPIGEQSIYSG